MPITLYMIPLSPPARTVLLTAEALGLKLNLKEVNLAAGDHLTEEFQKINPQHTVPVLDDNGTVLWDSHAIAAYLVRKYGKNDELYPKDFVKRAIVDNRLHFDSGTAFMFLRRIVKAFLGNKITSMGPEENEMLLEVYDFLEKFLTNSKWVAGDTLTIADLSLLATVTSLNCMLKIDPKKFPNITRWVGQGEQLPYFKVNTTGVAEFNTFLKSLLK